LPGRFLICHGTDTMAYTASAVTFLLPDMDRSVVFTGSQLPLTDMLSDGPANLRTAFAMAASSCPGVFLAFDRKVMLGCRAVILTNAAGGVNLSFKPGDIMIINDQIMLPGCSPMRGPNIPEFGPRFFDVQKMYSPELRAIAKECAQGSGLTFHEGCYFFMQGPQFETAAEIRAIRTLGGDAVGMSTVTEALTAAHCGLPCLGFSVITNMAAGILDQPLTDEEVNEVGHLVADNFSAYLKKVLSRM